MNSEIQIDDLELTQALDELAAKTSSPIAAQISEILRANQKRKRIAYYFEQSPGTSIGDYVMQVSDIYTRLHPYIHELQVEKSEKALNDLLKKMDFWARSFLSRKGFEFSEATRQLARDICMDAAAAVVKAYFPYDTEFDPWAVVLLQNICRKQLRDAGRRASRSVRAAILHEDWLERQLDPDALKVLIHVEARQDLLQAFQHLAHEEQVVLQLHYFQELKPAEISARLGKRQSQIYTIKFQALKKLKKELGPGGYD